MLTGTGRNLLGGIFPLIDTALFNNLGFPGAASLLGACVSDLTLELLPSVVLYCALQRLV